MKELIVRATDEALLDVQALVEGELAQAGASDKLIMEISVCLEELYVNIAHYAYGDQVGYATVHCGIEENCVTIQLEDSGTPFNPLDKEDPDITLSAEERRIGGLGIYMVKTFMDEVTYQYQDGKNILTIKKNLS